MLLTFGAFLAWETRHVSQIKTEYIIRKPRFSQGAGQVDDNVFSNHLVEKISLIPGDSIII